MKGNLLTIEGKVIKKLLKYETLYAKLWADDSGRNMAGDMEGTLIGIYPKLQLTIGRCNEEETAQLLSLFNRPYMTVTFYDAETRGFKTAKYYSNDMSTSLIRQSIMRYDSFSINIIPAKGR